MEEQLQKIAQSSLGIKTLETRSSDSLDFYDLAVWNIRKALEQAYEAGKQEGLEQGFENGQNNMLEAGYTI